MCPGADFKQLERISLTWVAAAVKFADDSPFRILRALHADILVED